MACIIVLYISLNYLLKRLNMKSKEWSTFCKLKLCNNILGLGYNNTKLGTHGKEKFHKEIKSIIIVQVCGNIDVWFRCCKGIDSCVSDKMKSKVSGERLIVFSWSCHLWLSDFQKDICREILVIFLELFLCWPEVVFIQRLERRESDLIPKFPRLK